MFLASGPERGQNRPQEAHFKHFWREAQNLARIGLRRLILSVSGLREKNLARIGLRRLILSISAARPRSWPK